MFICRFQIRYLPFYAVTSSYSHTGSYWSLKIQVNQLRHFITVTSKVCPLRNRIVP